MGQIFSKIVISTIVMTISYLNIYPIHSTVHSNGRELFDGQIAPIFTEEESAILQCIFDDMKMQAHSSLNRFLQQLPARMPKTKITQHIIHRAYEYAKYVQANGGQRLERNIEDENCLMA